MRLRALFPAAVGAALFLSACGDGSQIDIDIISIDECNRLDIIQNEHQVEITITGKDMTAITKKVSGNSHSVEIPEIPIGKARSVKVDVFRHDGLYATGTSAAFDLEDGGAPTVRVPLYRTNYFSRTYGGGSSGRDCTDMAEARAGHTAVALLNGEVLLAGGFTMLTDRKPDGFLRSTEIFDPATGRFRSAAPLPGARAHARGVVLRDGRVLLVGGERESEGEIVPLADAALYDGKGWKEIPMAAARKGHTVTALENGHVVVVGGVDETGKIVSTLEYFDPAANAFVAFEPVGAVETFARAWHVAESVQGGTLVVAGGVDPDAKVLNSVAHLIWDPSTQKYRGQLAQFQLSNPVFRATSMVVGGKANSTMVVAGGARNYTGAPPEQPGWGNPGEATDSVEWFEPISGGNRGSDVMAHKVFDACSASMGNAGLIVGGTPQEGRAAQALGDLVTQQGGTTRVARAGESAGKTQAVLYATCTNLGDRTLVVGGLDAQFKATDLAALYLLKNR